MVHLYYWILHSLLKEQCRYVSSGLANLRSRGRGWVWSWGEPRMWCTENGVPTRGTLVSHWFTVQMLLYLSLIKKKKKEIRIFFILKTSFKNLKEFVNSDLLVGNFRPKYTDLQWCLRQTRRKTTYRKMHIV